MPDLLRNVKDMIPQHVKRRYYDSRRAKDIRKQSDLSHVYETIRSIQNREPVDYMNQEWDVGRELTDAPQNIAAIEINDSCNLDCVMCKTSLAERGRKGLMEVSLFDEAVERLVARGMRSTNFHTLGDPIANRNLASYLEILRKNKVNITNMSSNCLLLKRHMDTIFEYRDIIGTFRPSIDAASKETYERIRVGGKWEDLHENLMLFTERNQREKHPFLVYVSSVASKDNWGELAMIPHVFSYVTPPTHFGFSLINTQEPTNDYFFKNSIMGDQYYNKAPCERMWKSIFVLKNGDMTTCCQDYYGDIIFGNLFKDDVDAAYNGEFLQSARKAHLEGDVASMPRVCQKCFTIDPRFDDILNGIFKHYFTNIKKHPVYLQSALNEMLPMFQKQDFKALMAVVENL